MEWLFSLALIPILLCVVVMCGGMMLMGMRERNRTRSEADAPGPTGDREDSVPRA